MIDYSLLMRRVMAQLELTGFGATMRFGEQARHRGEGMVVLPDLIKTEDDEIVWASVYWFSRQWQRARTDKRRRELVQIALEVLRLVKIRVKAKHDTTTLEGRLAVGREALRDGAKKVAMHYGYSYHAIYDWMDLARRTDERERLDREFYDGTMEMRVRIATTPGTAREVAVLYGVSQRSVSIWRLGICEKAA